MILTIYTEWGCHTNVKYTYYHIWNLSTWDEIIQNIRDLMPHQQLKSNKAGIQNYLLPYGSLGPTGHDSYWFQSTGIGSPITCWLASRARASQMTKYRFSWRVSQSPRHRCVRCIMTSLATTVMSHENAPNIKFSYVSFWVCRVPSSYEWVGVQWTHNFQNKGSKQYHKESIHFISFFDIWP